MKTKLIKTFYILKPIASSIKMYQIPIGIKFKIYGTGDDI